MKNYIVDDMETLADDIIFELTSQSTEFKNISVIGHYEDIEPIIKELARYDDVYFISLEIGLSGVVEYDDEYILSINNDYEVLLNGLREMASISTMIVKYYIFSVIARQD